MQQSELREPSYDEVRVRVRGCGVCASNLPVWEGRPWFSYPLERGAPGHEGWGTVDAVGSLVTRFAVGDPVALLSQHAYAQYEHVAEDALLKLPPGLGNRDFPAEPLGCAMNIFRRCQIEPAHEVAVVGVGFLGALLCALASRAGAKVVALSRRCSARELAEHFGAAASVDASDLARAQRQALQLVTQDGYARVIECGGTQESLDLASELTGTRGRLVIAGYHQDGPRRINLQQWNWRGIDVVNAHERDNREYLRGMQEAVDLALTGELDLSALFTHRFPLEELGAAFDAMARHEAGFVKALVLCA